MRGIIKINNMFFSNLQRIIKKVLPLHQKIKKQTIYKTFKIEKNYGNNECVCNNL